MNNYTNTSPLLIIDGNCIFCNSVAVKIFKADKKQQFYFTTNQSAFGLQILKKLNTTVDPIQTVVLYDQQKLFTKMEAVIRIAQLLGGAYKTFLLLKILPKSARNFIYDLIAKHRFKIFGRKNECRIDAKIPENKIVVS